MRFEMRLGSAWVGALLVAVGGWFLLRGALGLGPWFMAATLTVLALGFAAAWAARRREGHLAWACVFASWAAYVAVGSAVPGGLGFPYFLAFLGAGFILLYLLRGRQSVWAVVPGYLLLGLGGVLAVFSLGLSLAPYWVPALLIAYGVWLLRRPRYRP